MTRSAGPVAYRSRNTTPCRIVAAPLPRTTPPRTAPKRPPPTDNLMIKLDPRRDTADLPACARPSWMRLSQNRTCRPRPGSAAVIHQRHRIDPQCQCSRSLRSHQAPAQLPCRPATIFATQLSNTRWVRVVSTHLAPSAKLNKIKRDDMKLDQERR
jgi:hypothetical protein